MKDKLLEILNSIFSIFILVAIFGGALIFLFFLLALVIGGEKGANLSIFASKSIMPYFIKAAAIGILAGLIELYLSRDHHLSLK